MNNVMTILALIPSLIKAIKAIEEAIPLPGQGKAKLDAVLEIVSTADATIKGILPLVTSAIATLVKLFNSTGIFGVKTI